VLEFRILGPLEVSSDHGPIRLGGPKQRSTLGILLLDANRVVSVDRLADELYAGAAPVTAVTQVQRQVSELRKALGSESVIETRTPGYVIRLSPEQLDLHRFERLVGEAADAVARSDLTRGADLLRDALELWRGDPLADLAYESFAQKSIARLEEVRLAALEQRLDIDLALGRHAAIVGELEQVTLEHPLRERFRAQLMLALYRSGRQVESLGVYQRTREALVAEFGIEPTPALRNLERAVLAHDPALGLEQAAATRALLVAPSSDGRLASLLAIAEPLATLPSHDLIIARLVASERELEAAVSELKARASSLPAGARTAAFTTTDVAGDVIRLATTYDVDLVLLDAPSSVEAERVPDRLAALLERSPADVAVVAGPTTNRPGAGVFVPFGGGEHDWAALELGAWIASAAKEPLRLVGVKADPRLGRRDASRLLADASLAVQRVAGVETEPLLAEADEEGLLEAVAPASVVVSGLSPRWRQEGIGDARRTLVRHARVSTLLVHRGPRPGGLAPRESRTRFTWTIDR
jgi:DNA-binding SARP family transcriptional activator